MTSLLFLLVLFPSCKKSAPVQVQHIEEDRYPPPKVEEPKCVIKSGEVALLTRDGILDPRGQLWKPLDCRFEGSSTLRFHYNEEPADEDQPMSSEIATPEAPTSETVEAVQEPAVVMQEPLTEASAGVSTASELADVSGAADAAAKLGGDYAPLVGLALAAMAILGGGKAWAFYKERSEQKHALEMAKLKMQAQDPNMRPQPCKQAQAQLDEKLESIERKIAKLERHSFDLGDFDGDDCIRRLKKLERRLSDED